MPNLKNKRKSRPARKRKNKQKRKFLRVGNFYVYIVECSDSTFYTGYTPDLERRIRLHNSGKGAKYTRDRRPVKLLWSKRYSYFKKAFLKEKMIKRLTRAEKKELIKNVKIR